MERPTADPTAEEAAAIVAAVELFLRATAPQAASSPRDERDSWSTTALLEGVGRDPWVAAHDPWVHPSR